MCFSSGSRSARSSTCAERSKLAAARTPDATGMYAASDSLLELEDDFEPRLVVDSAAGHATGTAYDLSAGATLGPRRRRDPTRRSVRLLAPCQDLSAGTGGRDRGSRVDERHLPQRRAAHAVRSLCTMATGSGSARASSPTSNDPDPRAEIPMLQAVETAYRTDTGRQRRGNEDSLFAAPAGVRGRRRHGRRPGR